MAKGTYKWYTVVALTVISISALSGLILIGTAGYEFAQILSEEKLENKVRKEILLIQQVDCHGYALGNHIYYTGDQGKYTRLCKDKDETAGTLQFDGAHTYKLILILCLLAIMILGFIQFVGGAMVICSCNSVRLRSNIKAWIMTNCFVFLLGILCIVIPLSYNVDEATHFNMKGFSSYATQKFKQIVEIRDLEKAQEHLFFLVSGTNEVLLFLSILILTALLPCGTQPYESVYGG